MKLLEEGSAEKAVIRTPLTRKLTLDGVTRPYPVYKIRLDWLFYNDQNDRIATWISEYRAEHDGQAPDPTDREAYNKIIEPFILDSNMDAIHKTQTNIEMVNQREPGVVLNDGRIVDGNRRFTCLRRLSDKYKKTNDNFNYFEAVILDRDIESNLKQIKMLELSIQHGEESRVAYNPVDRLVGIYNDIIDSKLLSVEEYARSTNESESNILRRMEVAKLMVDFLEFINAPKQFYIVRDLQIIATLEELPSLLRKCRSDVAKEEMKHIIFTNILMRNSGELRKFIRDITKIVGTEYQDDFFAEQQKFSAQIINKLPEKGSIKAIRDLISDEADIGKEMESSVDKALTKVKKNETRNRPIVLAEKATNCLEDMDKKIIRKLNDGDRQRLIRQLDRLEMLTSEIRTELRNSL